MRLMDEEHLKHPARSFRQMVDFWEDQGFDVNRKRVQRLMRKMNLATILPDSGDMIRLLDRRPDNWDNHFAMREYVVLGLTPMGRIVAFRSAKVRYFRGAKGDNHFASGP